MNEYQRRLLQMLLDIRRRPTTLLRAYWILKATERMGFYQTTGD